MIASTVENNLARVTRAPGRICINPVEVFDGGAFPYGGTFLGKARACILKPVGQSYRVEFEALGRTGEVLKGNNRVVFSCFLRGWDDAALTALRQGAIDAGDRTQHAVFSVPGNQVTGSSALWRAVVVAYVPDDPINVPGFLLFNAVPVWGQGAEFAFQRKSELGLPVSFECLRDTENRILQIGRIADLTL